MTQLSSNVTGITYWDKVATTKGYHYNKILFLIAPLDKKEYIKKVAIFPLSHGKLDINKISNISIFFWLSSYLSKVACVLSCSFIARYLVCSGMFGAIRRLDALPNTAATVYHLPFAHSIPIYLGFGLGLALGIPMVALHKFYEFLHSVMYNKWSNALLVVYCSSKYKIHHQLLFSSIKNRHFATCILIYFYTFFITVYHAHFMIVTSYFRFSFSKLSKYTCHFSEFNLLGLKKIYLLENCFLYDELQQTEAEYQNMEHQFIFTSFFTWG